MSLRPSDAGRTPLKRRGWGAPRRKGAARTRGSVQEALVVACVTGAVVLLTACGPQVPAARPLPEGPGGPPRLSEQIEWLEQSDRPTLQVIRRRGDPRGALGIALFAPRGSFDVVLLSQLFESRLRRAGWQVNVREHSLALVLTLQLPSSAPSTADWAGSVFEILHQKVSEQEARRIESTQPIAQLAERGVALSPLGMCRSDLGSEGTELLRSPLAGTDAWLAELEQARSSSVVAPRVGLGIVGEASWVEQGVALQQMDWQPAEPVVDAWDATPATSVRSWGAGPELALALRVPGAAEALSAARSLEEPTHPLRARLAAVSADAGLQGVSVTLRPAGACLGLQLSTPTLPGRRPEQDLAELAVIALQEAMSELERRRSDEERALALVAPSTAVETAALAAWTAVRSPHGGRGVKRYVEFRGPAASGVSSAALAQAVETTWRDWHSREIPVVARDELGQGELWMLVASPCTGRAEANELAGQRALLLGTLARQWNGRDGVRLDSWMDPRGSGLLAHGPALRGESPGAHAARLARVLGSAFFGATLDGRTVAAVRGELLSEVGSDPGRDLLASILGGEHAAMLRPRGSDLSVSVLATTDLERERDEFVREPLRLAALENGGAGQAQAAGAALGQWLAAARTHPAPCPATHWKPADPGQWTLETVDEEVPPSLRLGVPIEATPEAGRVLAGLLTPLLPESEASWWGARDFGALVLRVAAPEEPDAALVRLRQTLERLSTAPVSRSTIESALMQAAAADETLLRFPAARVIDLWLTGESRPQVTPEDILALFSKLAADRHRIVRVDRR